MHSISTLLKEFKNNNDQFVLFPNPANAETTLLLNLLEPSDVSISILDNLGQIVYKSSSYYKSGANSINIDTYNYKSGCYSIEIITKKGVVSKGSAFLNNNGFTVEAILYLIFLLC